MCGVSFNHLVGANEQRRWHSDAESLRRFEVDDQFNVGRKLDRQVGGLGAFQYSVHVVRRTMVAPIQIDAVADKAARIDMLAIAIDRGQPLRRCGLGNRLPRKNEHTALLNDHRLDASLGEGLVCRVDIGGGPHFRRHDLDL